MREIYKTLSLINSEWKVTLIIAEQDVKLALSIARYCYFLETGLNIANGPSEEMAKVKLFVKFIQARISDCRVWLFIC